MHLFIGNLLSIRSNEAYSCGFKQKEGDRNNAKKNELLISEWDTKLKSSQFEAEPDNFRVLFVVVESTCDERIGGGKASCKLQVYLV